MSMSLEDFSIRFFCFLATTALEDCDKVFPVLRVEELDLAVLKDPLHGAIFNFIPVFRSD